MSLTVSTTHCTAKSPTYSLELPSKSATYSLELPSPPFLESLFPALPFPEQKYLLSFILPLHSIPDFHSKFSVLYLPYNLQTRSKWFSSAVLSLFKKKKKNTSPSTCKVAKEKKCPNWDDCLGGWTDNSSFSQDIFHPGHLPWNTESSCINGKHV